MSDEVIQVDQYDIDKVVEVECHGLLKSGSIIFKAKRHDSICKCAPGGCESSLVSVFFLDLNLVISGETVHEQKDLMSSVGVNDLVNEWSREVVFGTCQIQVMKISTNMDGTLFFIHGRRIRNPSGIHDGVYETCFMQFLDFDFDNMSL